MSSNNINLGPHQVQVRRVFSITIRSSGDVRMFGSKVYSSYTKFANDQDSFGIGSNEMQKISFNESQLVEKLIGNPKN